MASDTSWQVICKQVQNYRDKTIKDTEELVGGFSELPADLPVNVTSIPATVLTKDEITLTELLPEHLLWQLASGEITATAVLAAFLRRAALAQQLVNCITELMPKHAMERAKKLDDYYKDEGKPIGPLHGLPISVKEHISMKDLDCNCGFVSWVGKLADQDALILKILWDAGAVFYARTTQPQTLVSSSSQTSNLVQPLIIPADAPGDIE
jgi:amidase